MTKRYIGLLRGVNVGGKNRLPMARLREIFVELGAEEVATYIQSGNVVFTSSARVAAALPAKVSARLAAELGLSVPLLLRSSAELQRALDAHPFADRDVPDKYRHIMFLDRKPSAARAVESSACWPPVRSSCAASRRW